MRDFDPRLLQGMKDLSQRFRRCHTDVSVEFVAGKVTGAEAWDFSRNHST